MNKYEKYKIAIREFEKYLAERIKWTRNCKALDCAQDEYYIWLMFCHVFNIGIDERSDL